MVGMIEHQQGIQHSSLVEKIQQVKQDHLNVYQQQAAGELQQKNIQAQRMVPEPHTSAGIRVDEKGRRQGGRRYGKRQNTHTPDDEQPSSDRIIDIIA